MHGPMNVKLIYLFSDLIIYEMCPFLVPLFLYIQICHYSTLVLNDLQVYSYP